MNGISADESKTINTSLIAVSFGTLSADCLELTDFPLQAIDTGTSLIYVPDSVADDFYAQVCSSQSGENADSEFPAQILGSRKVAQFGPSTNSLQASGWSNPLTDFHSYPCASSVAPSLTFNDHRFTLDLRDFNLGKTGYGSS